MVKVDIETGAVRVQSYRTVESAKVQIVVEGQIRGDGAGHRRRCCTSASPTTHSMVSTNLMDYIAPARPKSRRSTNGSLAEAEATVTNLLDPPSFSTAAESQLTFQAP